MALQRQRGELPPGATILSESDAIEYQWKVIWNWKPKSDVWPFSYGIGMLGGLSTLAGLYINNHYRSKLRLGKYGRLSSYLPIVFLPTAMSALFHQQVISNDIVIQKTVCPTCIEMRAVGIQCFFGMVYPTVLAPMGNFMFAVRHGTYNLPFITSDYKSVFRLWQKFTLPISNVLLAICIVQAVAAMGITYLEAKSYFTVQTKLAKLEKYYDEKAGHEWNRQQ